MTTIDEDALRAGLEREATDLRSTIARDEQRLADEPGDALAPGLELQRSQLRKVEHALDRHDDGTWQQCEACDGVISDDQIRAVATATHCTKCAEQQVFWGDTTTIDLDELDLPDE